MAIELTDITSGYNLSKINANFQTLEDYINQKVLARADTGVAGEGKMERDLDMDGHRILNADIDGSTITNDRAVRVTGAYIPPIPQSLEERKGKIVSFDINTGNPIAISPASGSATDVLNQLAGPGTAQGDALVAVKQPFLGSVLTTQHNKNAQYISAKDFGATGNGTLVPISTKYATLAAAQVDYPFVTALTDSLDYVGIQAAINSGLNVHVPAGTYYINKTIVINKNVKITGESNSIINRPGTFLSVVGNIACFNYSAQFTSGELSHFYIFYDGGRPTVAAGNDGKIGILFNGGATSPGLIKVDHIDIDGAWWGVYDDSGCYLSEFDHVWVRRSAHGFFKNNGTTILYKNCYVMEAVNGWYVVNCASPTLLNCASDQLQVDSNKSFNSCGNYFQGTKCLSIIGFDAETNVIDNTSAVLASLFQFNDCYVDMTGFVGHGNTIKTTVGAGDAQFIRAIGSSKVHIRNSRDSFLDADRITYVGSGGFLATLGTDSTSRIIVTGSRIRSATGGTPASSVAAQGNINFIDCDITGAIVSGATAEYHTGDGLKVQAVYTDKGSKVVPASVSTALFDLPDTQGAYHISVWATGSGTNYCATLDAVYDGTTVFLQNIKTAAFLTFVTSGRTFGVTSSGATTLQWVYTKVG